MAAVNIFKYTTSSPADTTPLQYLEKEGHDASDIVAVIGKTEGNGCVNDFSRTLSSHVWEAKIPPSAVTVFSGGTEGVLSPHVTFFVRSKERTGLVAVSESTRDFAPHEVGTGVQSREVAGVISKMISDAGISKDSIHLVLIKCPLLTSADIEEIRAAGQVPITTDTYQSMARSRSASALGIALALEEISLEKVTAGLDGMWSSRASCSSGAELKNCHIMILAADPKETHG